MKHIGILGGTFDPIHLGHVQIARAAYEQLNLDEVWLMPVLNNPFSKNIIATNKQRLDMIQLAIQDDPYIKVCDYELHLDPNVKTYTYNTMLELVNDDTKFYFIIGMDQAIYFNKWYKAKELSDLVQIVVFDRKGYQDINYFDDFNMMHIECDACDASSTMIKLGNFEYLSHSVIEYMFENDLYIHDIIQKYMSAKRYQHTLGVSQLAIEFAINNGVSPLKAKIAALLHDIAKEMDDIKANELMDLYYKEHKSASKPVWHQWLSTYVAKNTFNIQDEEILQAITNHTTASTNMSKLDMIIYCADKYDPNRGFDNTMMVNLCNQSIEEGFKEALIDFVQFSKKKNRPIDESFFEVYKKYVGE